MAKVSAKKPRATARRKSVRLPRVVASDGIAASSEMTPAVDWKKFLSTKYLVGVAIILLLAGLLWKNKSLVVAATVNGQPVPRWELENRLVSRYGNQTLDEVVNEVLIRQAGQKGGVDVAPKEVDGKISEVEKTLDGKISLSEALTQQGMTMADFRAQVELQLILDKLSASSVTVTDRDVADYIASNSGLLTSTDPASQSAEAKSILLSQKKNAAYRQIFGNLKSQAKVTKFL